MATLTQRAMGLMKSGQPQQAVALLNPVISHASKFLPALVTYARGLGMIGQHARSAEVYSVVCKQAPEKIDLRTEYAVVLKRSGQYDKALENVRHARSIQKWFSRAVFLEADVLMDMSQHEEAAAILTDYAENAPEIERTPQNAAQLCSTRVRLVPKLISAESFVDEVLLHSANEQVSKNLRSVLCARAANMLDMLDRCDEAIEVQARSKELRGLKWDAESHTRRMEAGVKAWTSDEAKGLPVSTVDGSGHIFIVGMPRSGTSLLEQMLSRHPEIQPLGERNDMTVVAGTTQQPAPGLLPIVSDLTKWTPEHCQKIAEHTKGVIDKLREPGKRFVVDKQPFNYAHVPLMARVLPGCRVIHILRDPRDTCISYHMQWFNGSHGQANSFDTLGQYYRDYRRMMDAWQQLEAPMMRPELMDVHYEDLVSDPEPVAHQIMEFLGLEFDPIVLDHTSSSRIVTTASRDQVKNKLYTSSVQRWKRFEKHLGPLAEHAGEYFKD
jgi:Tfp pilus assembly protein PilF